jgi:dipeptidase
MRRKILQGLLSLTVICSLILAAASAPACDSVTKGFECSSLAAGIKATVDGSVLFGHNEDDSKCPTLMYLVDRKYHEPGEVIEMWDIELPDRTKGTIPQVEETYAYLWSYMPGFRFSDSYLNEYGVSIASDNCRSSREDQPELTPGIGYWLRRLVAERAMTAREGVEIMGEAVEDYGYDSSGRTYIVADPKEAWLFAAVNGKHWCAQRVPDHHVAFIPNYYTIRKVNLKDTDNFLACPDLIEYAEYRGWYDPETDGEFDFAKVYNTPGTQASFRNQLRHWGALRLLTGQEYPDMNDLPFSVRLNRKLSVQDIIEVLRCHYEGTYWEWDPEGGYGHPHYYKVDDTSIRPICASSTQESFVMQLRSYMPSIIGNVYWRAQCRPCESVFVPWYSGIVEVPHPYEVGKSNRDSAKEHAPEYYDKKAAEDMNSAYWAFDKMTDLVNDDYLERIGIVRDFWDGFESAEFAQQDEIEKTALKICDEDENFARWFLTGYTKSLGLVAYYKALEFIERFE